LLAGLAQGAVLFLDGSASGQPAEVWFGVKDGVSNARLSATCQDDTPLVFTVEPRTFLMDPAVTESRAANVTLGNVAASCTAVRTMKTPCTPGDDPSWPALFHCVWSTNTTEVVTGPLRANRTWDVQDDVRLGLRTSVTCPLPTLMEQGALAGEVGGMLTGDVIVTLGIRYFSAAKDVGTMFTFDGIPGGNLVRFHPHSPPAPPIPPPEAPPPNPLLPPHQHHPHGHNPHNHNPHRHHPDDDDD